MKRLLLFVILLLQYSYSVAQDNKNKIYTDSLSKVLQTAANDSIKARSAYLLSNHWIKQKDTLQSLRYLDKGRQLSGKNSYLNALYAFYKGSYLFIKDGETQECMNWYKQAALLFAKHKSKESYEFQVKSWHNYAMMLDHKDNKKGMVEILINKAIPAAELAEDHEWVARSYGNIGMAFANTATYDKAIEYYEKSIRYYEQHNLSKDRYAIVLLDLARVYVESKNADKATPYIRKAETILRTIPKSVAHLILGETASMYYQHKKDYTKAEGYIKQAIAVATELNMPYELNSLRYQYFNVYFNQKKFPLALKELYAVMENMPFEMANNRQQIALDLSDTYKEMGDYKNALTWMKNHAALKDSIYEENTKKEIADLEIKFKTAEKEKKIVQLEAEKQQTLLQQKNQLLFSWILGIGACLLLCVLSVFIYFYKQHKKQAQQQLSMLKQQQELKFAQAMLAGEEQERSRLARDLHDGLGGALVGIKYKLAAEAETTSINAIRKQLDNSISELRHIARNMMPETLVRSGLTVALEDLCTSLHREGLVIELQCDEIKSDIPPGVQSNMYRIIQELLNNAIRHGNATRIIVQCFRNDEGFLITVEDNGKGFDVSQTEQQGKGIGLQNVRMRASYMKGNVDISSVAGEGTSVNIELLFDKG
ncbi:tetratricopeptide repeat-containing sensor histidine kinase [Sphingobacterium spiritivorum]|uniref:tetratricopeptide repeat-containing sensor histidine kinase n=1 Tax=Sphingobacterium spiritivorum TaxID=258 RepID=UPI003DA55E60